MERCPSHVLAHGHACSLGLVLDDGFLSIGDSDEEPSCGAFSSLESCHYPLLFCGVSGRSPEQDAQPYLRVAEGGLEKWWWARGTLKGFRAHSAFLAIQCLAIHRLAFRLFALNSTSDHFSTQDNNTINLR